MKFGITINIGDYNSLRLESSEHEKPQECYEEVFSILKDWEGNFDSIKWWIDKLQKKMTNDNTPKKPIKMMTALDLENIEIADEMAKNATKFKPKIYKVVNKFGEYLRCNKCNGIISWDLRPERAYPLHCDELGQIVGDGNCPEYQ